MSDLEQAVRRERDRAATIPETLAAIYRVKAKGVRKKGTFSTRSIWPPFRKAEFVMPAHERAARILEEAALTLDIVANLIRSGAERLMPVDPNKKIETTFGDMCK